MTMNNYHIFKEKLINRKNEIIKILNNLTNEIKELTCSEVCDEGDEAMSAMDSGRKQQIYITLKSELEEINIALKKIENLIPLISPYHTRFSSTLSFSRKGMSCGAKPTH
jgi:DnaK suppressor protein